MDLSISLTGSCFHSIKNILLNTMHKLNFFVLLISMVIATPLQSAAQADETDYLSVIKEELIKEWPKNKTINLVFHGHSVPSGYFKTPVVNTFDSYPFLVLKELKLAYPNAVVNVIITAKGGENSENGEKRFEEDVLTHKPDVLFIDYVLNDRGIGIQRSTAAMKKMIKAALEKKIKIILLTPTPHQNYDLLDTTNAYEPFAKGIIDLAKEYKLGLVDSYKAFREKIKEGHAVSEYMSQVNHPNKEGHQLVADEIMKWFK